MPGPRRNIQTYNTRISKVCGLNDTGCIHPLSFKKTCLNTVQYVSVDPDLWSSDWPSAGLYDGQVPPTIDDYVKRLNILADDCGRAYLRYRNGMCSTGKPDHETRRITPGQLCAFEERQEACKSDVWSVVKTPRASFLLPA